MPLTAAGGFARFLGGGGTDEALGVAVDLHGSTYVTGWTWSFGFPAAPGLVPFRGLSEGFVVKLDTDGNVVFATFLGGSSDHDAASDIAVNNAGQAHITGETMSQDFPTVRAHQPILRGSCNAFVTKLNESGTDLIYSTYLGGEIDDGGTAIAVDSAGYAYVTGVTHSPSFPTTPGTFSRGPVVIEDSFVAKFTPEGFLKYSTLLGGRGCVALDIALGGPGYEQGLADAFITGRDFRTIPGVPVSSPVGGGQEAFVVRLDRAGASLHYLAYIGGTWDEAGHGIAVDAADNAYVTGWSESDNFLTTDGTPLRTAPSPYGGWIHHCFLVKLDDAGALLHSIVLQGSEDDWGSDIALDQGGDVYLTGGTYSSFDFPITSDALPSPRSFESTFIAIVRGDRLTYCTFLGGGQGEAIAVDDAANVYVAGNAFSALGFPVGSPVYAGGPIDAFVARVRRF